MANKESPSQKTEREGTSQEATSSLEALWPELVDALKNGTRLTDWHRGVIEKKPVRKNRVSRRTIRVQ